MANPAADEASDDNAEIIKGVPGERRMRRRALGGTTMILIHHIGARSWVERVTPSGCCSPQGDGRFVIVASGADRPPTQTGTTTSRPTQGSPLRSVLRR